MSLASRDARVNGSTIGFGFEAIHLNGGRGDDTLTGHGGYEDLFGAAGDDTLNTAGGGGEAYGEVGHDTHIGGAGKDLLIAGIGHGTIDMNGGGGIAMGEIGDDTLIGGIGNDQLFGGEGNAMANRLIGNGAANVLSGGAGGDVLAGGRGADILTGGVGNDSFPFNRLSERGDLLTDLSNQVGNNDQFRISAAGFGGGLIAGTSQFQIRTDNLAQDGNDRFIFRSGEHADQHVIVLAEAEVAPQAVGNGNDQRESQ